MPAQPVSGLVISPVVATFWKCLQSPVAFQTGLDCTTDQKNIFRGNFYSLKIFNSENFHFDFVIEQSSGLMKTLRVG